MAFTLTPLLLHPACGGTTHDDPRDTAENTGTGASAGGSGGGGSGASSSAADASAGGSGGGATQDAGHGQEAAGSQDAAANDDAQGTIACRPDLPCPDGMQCVGSGCDEPWHCAPGPWRADCGELQSNWCGCDGVTSVGCSPDRPYVHDGVCPGEATVDCDDRRVRPECGDPPACPKGHVPAIREDGCWGGWCVLIGACKCTEDEECPNTDIYTCWLSGQCGPFTL